MKRISVFYLSILLMMFLFSCNKKNDETCKSCETQSSFKVVTKLSEDLGNLKVATSVWADNKTKVGYEFADASIENEKDFKVLHDKVESLLIGNKGEGQDVYGYVFYRTGQIHNDAILSLETISSISRYYFSGDKLYHQLYTLSNDGKGFKEFENLTSEVDGIVSNQIHKISSKILNMPPASSSLLIANEAKGELEKKLVSPHDLLNSKLNYLLKALEKNNIKSILNDKNQAEKINSYSEVSNISENPESCGSPCFTTKFSCRRGIGGNWACGGTFDCAVSTGIDQINTNNFWQGSDSLNMCYNSSLLYTFRDNVLVNNSFGQKYIDYFYSLSTVLKSNIDLESAVKTGRVLLNVNATISTLLNNNANASSVLINKVVFKKVCKSDNYYYAC